MHDPFALLISTLVMTLYSRAGHDYWWCTLHSRHHRLIDGDYFAFGDLHFWKWIQKNSKRDAGDRVRSMVMSRVSVTRRARAE